jgi:peptidoglycan/xylan/chitin deacetylase (PgdA/CDA1 family)
MSTAGSSTAHDRRARFLLVAACAMLLWVRLDRAPAALQTAPTVPILMYHHIGDWGPSNPGWADWVVKPTDFAQQLDWLKSNGYRTITFRELLADQAVGRAPAPKSVIISFDDGWSYQGVVIHQELEPRGMHAVLFVYPGAIGPTPNGGGYISWLELLDLEASGNEVQSHTLTHPRLTDVQQPSLDRELRESRAILETQLGHPARVVAYPFGAHDERVMQAAGSAGYDLAVRADDEPSAMLDGPLRLPRIRVGYGEGLDVFRARLKHAESSATVLRFGT